MDFAGDLKQNTIREIWELSQSQSLRGDIRGCQRQCLRTCQAKRSLGEKVALLGAYTRQTKAARKDEHAVPQSS